MEAKSEPPSLPQGHFPNATVVSGQMGKGAALGRDCGEEGNPVCQGQKPTAWRRECLTFYFTSSDWQTMRLELDPVSLGSCWQ